MKMGVLNMLRKGRMYSDDEERLEEPHRGADSVTRTIRMQAHRWGGRPDEHTCDGP